VSLNSKESSPEVSHRRQKAIFSPKNSGIEQHPSKKITKIFTSGVAGSGSKGYTLKLKRN
jgi:hypothetical protein